MKRKLLLILLVILVISNITLLFMVFKKPKHHKAPHKFLFKELKFNEEQLKIVEPLKQVHIKNMKSLDEEIKPLRKSIFKEVNNKDFNIDSISQLIGVKESKKDQEVYNYFNQIYKVCDDKQKLKFNDFLKNAMKGPKPKGPNTHHKRKKK